MDPNECIRIGIAAAERGDEQAAFEQLNHYEAWIRNGSFAADADLVEKLLSMLKANVAAFWGDDTDDLDAWT